MTRVQGTLSALQEFEDYGVLEQQSQDSFEEMLDKTYDVVDIATKFKVHFY